MLSLRTLLAATIVFLLVANARVMAQSDEFDMANRLYEQKDYESAIRMYESIISQYGESAELYFNLGNAYFKAGDLGYAVVNYHRARRLDPGDEDILHNLEFASQYTQVQMEGVALNPIQSMLQMIVGPYRLNTLAWLSSVLFVLLMAGLIVRFGLALNTAVVRVSVTVCLILLVVVSGLTTFKYRHDYLTRRAVIVSEQSPVYTGPSVNSDIELQGSPGLVVEILEEDSDFYSVLFENKRRGWIEKSQVAVI